MNRLFNIRASRLQRWLIASLALAFFAIQVAGVVHAFDADAHEDGRACHACPMQQPAGAAHAPALDAATPKPAGRLMPVEPVTALIAAPYHRRPPTRAPPR